MAGDCCERAKVWRGEVGGKTEKAHLEKWCGNLKGTEDKRQQVGNS